MCCKREIFDTIVNGGRLQHFQALNDCETFERAKAVLVVKLLGYSVALSAERINKEYLHMYIYIFILLYS